MSMVERLVERVAMAIALDRAEPWDDLSDDERRSFTATAVAAITAMRLPTSRMLKAAAASMSAGKRPTQRRVSNSAKYAIRYRAMIDAELRWHERVAHPQPNPNIVERTEG
jgi:hypothetical protein